MESFSHHLRERSELCVNVHQEGTMKQQLITVLPQRLRIDAHVEHRDDCGYQQFTTYLSGKNTAAPAVIELALSAMPPASSSRRPPTIRHQAVNVTYPVMAVAPAAQPGTPQPRGSLSARPGQVKAFTGITQRSAVPAAPEEVPSRC